MTRRVLVTGAGGFVGSALRAHLRAQGIPLVGVVRALPLQAQAPDLVAVGDLLGVEWPPLLDGIDTIIHLAALAHQLAARDELAYVQANIEVTGRLLAAASSARVRRFVFASSVKVNGEETTVRPFDDDDPPAPQDAYARSKWAAEQRVGAVADRIETVVLRLPLIYGPGVRANFAALLRAVERGLPLPFASVRNARSLLSVANLVSALDTARASAPVIGGTFLVCDGEDLSTPALIGSIARAMRRRPRLVACPPTLLELAAGLVGRAATMRRLTRSLQVDGRRFRAVSGWFPPQSLDQGIADTVAWASDSARTSHGSPPGAAV